MYSVNCKINMKKLVFFVKNHVPSEMLPFIVHYKHLPNIRGPLFLQHKQTINIDCTLKLREECINHKSNFKLCAPSHHNLNKIPNLSSL